MVLNPSVKQCFHCCHVGLEHIYSCGRHAYSVILTSSSDSSKSIMDDFNLFLTVLENELGCSISYFVVQTTEGNGVLHCLFDCDFLHKDMLSNFWSRFHHGFVVQCKCVGNTHKDIFSISSYLAYGQHSETMNYFVGFYVSSGWHCNDNDGYLKGVGFDVDEY
jgi:hypothetical protein